MSDTIITGKLPAPRLQFRWVEHTGDHPYGWECHYELVLPLREFDIRREVWKDGEEVGQVDELVVPMKAPTMRGGGGLPCTAPDGTRYCDTPYRDGAHARWDAEVIGNPPIYCIAPDAVVFKVEPPKPRT